MRQAILAAVVGSFAVLGCSSEQPAMQALQSAMAGASGQTAAGAGSGGPSVACITGDVVTNGMVSAGWGLHLIDMNLTMGDLIEGEGQVGRLRCAQVTGYAAVVGVVGI